MPWKAFPLPPGEGEGEGGMKVPLDPELLDIARKPRTNQTDVEKLLWNILCNRRMLGLKFRR